MRIKILVIDKEKNDLLFIMEGDEGVKDVFKKAVQDLLVLNKVNNEELEIRDNCVITKVPFKETEDNFFL